MVGGTEATGNYHVYAHHTRGAVLVFRSWLLTNAQCVTDMPGDTTGISSAAKHFFVRAGSRDRSSGGEMAIVAKIVVHPGWNEPTARREQAVDDITMLKLGHAVNLPSASADGGLAARTQRKRDGAR